jgi:hypothetical protein
MEKHTFSLEQPEALGIYVFSKHIFKYLHKRSNEGYSGFNSSHDILNKIPSNADLFSYDSGDDVEVHSFIINTCPTYLGLSNTFKR